MTAARERMNQMDARNRPTEASVSLPGTRNRSDKNECLFLEQVIAACACAFLAVALARPQQQQQPQQYKPPVPIISQDAALNVDGSHHSSFQTADGVTRSEQGVQRQLGPNDAGEAIQGQVAWTDNEGVSHQLSYTADENGYQPQGDLVPAIPAAIQRALEWNAAHPEEEDPKDSQRQ